MIVSETYTKNSGKPTWRRCLLSGVRLIARHSAHILLFFLAVVIVVQQIVFNQRVAVLQDAGPIGYYLLNGRRWVMSAVIASGKGMKKLLELESLATERSTSLRWGERCWKENQPHVLVAVPFNPMMPEALQQTLAEILDRLEYVLLLEALCVNTMGDLVNSNLILPFLLCSSRL
jgi:hypothetical protein